VSPSSREREYARRRYEKWQAKQAARAESRRQARRNAIAAGAAVAVVAVVALTVHFVQGSGTGTTAAGATTTPSAAAGATTAGATAASNPCPAPTVKPPATPKTWPSAPPAAQAAGRTWRLALETTCGPVLIALDGAKAPRAVASTLFLARSGFYDSTPCHRLTTKGIFVLQCGDPTGKGTGGPGYSYGPVENAPKGDLYPAGTVAMARRSGDGKSMGSQFFLVYKDSTIPSDAGGGYTVLGKIIGGLAVVEKVAAGGVAADGTAPTRAISIVSATVSPG
jgi:peptidyl-prolyl cis-trans isomerase B (cyclophilin B)